ncbi:carbonic anhydrase 4 isoform X2 [Esox lucius]|uniref:carbonic anhydrase 4 isoform X2 n=1 Tax=Esox lucius TaxID=8010 RepID=UPI001476E5CA|nr:carbonic anhydrase 4 isoform X2 [Esox lucius]
MQQHLILPFVLASFMKTCTGTNWCYQSQENCTSPCNGPEMWPIADKACDGKAQSPINIVHRKTLTDKRLTPLQFENYQNSFESLIQNIGHYVQVTLPHNASVIGGDLEMPYKAVQFHLHWGNKGGPGSEHTIDGEQYPMEESPRDNRKYDPIVKALQSIVKPGTNTSLGAVSLEQLIPSQQNLTKFYRYRGSLTTPGCTESVIWTVFENPIPLSKEQLEVFSNLQFKDGKPMVATFRPVQPLNGRKVYRSGGAVVLASTTLLVASIAMAMGLSQPN